MTKSGAYVRPLAHGSIAQSTPLFLVLPYQPVHYLPKSAFVAHRCPVECDCWRDMGWNSGCDPSRVLQRVRVIFALPTNRRGCCDFLA